MWANLHLLPVSRPGVIHLLIVHSDGGAHLILPRKGQGGYCSASLNGIQTGIGQLHNPLCLSNGAIGSSHLHIGQSHDLPIIFHCEQAIGGARIYPLGIFCGQRQGNRLAVCGNPGLGLALRSTRVGV